MSELARYRRWMTVSILIILMICFLIAALFPAIQTVGVGVALGAVISWINASYLGRKVRIMSEDAVGGNLKRVNLGFDKSSACSARCFPGDAISAVLQYICGCRRTVPCAIFPPFIGIILSRNTDV